MEPGYESGMYVNGLMEQQMSEDYCLVLGRTIILYGSTLIRNKRNHMHNLSGSKQYHTSNLDGTIRIDKPNLGGAVQNYCPSKN